MWKLPRQLLLLTMMSSVSWAGNGKNRVTSVENGSDVVNAAFNPLTLGRPERSNLSIWSALRRMGPLKFFQTLAAQSPPMDPVTESYLHEYELHVETFMNQLLKNSQQQKLNQILSLLEQSFQDPEMNPTLQWAWFMWSASSKVPGNFQAWFKSAKTGQVSLRSLELAFQRIDSAEEVNRSAILPAFVQFAQREDKMTYLLLSYLSSGGWKTGVSLKVLSTIIEGANGKTLTALLNLHFSSLIPVVGNTADPVLLQKVIDRILYLTKKDLISADESNHLTAALLTGIRSFVLDRRSSEKSPNWEWSSAHDLAGVVESLVRNADLVERKEISNMLFTLPSSTEWAEAFRIFVNSATEEELEFLVSARMTHGWAFEDAASLQILDMRMGEQSQETFAQKLRDRGWSKEKTTDVLSNCPLYLKARGKKRAESVPQA